MTFAASHSPPDLHIETRSPKFELQQALATDWHGGDEFRTAFFNAMSCLFPIGEKFFIDSVRHFRPQIDDPRLLQEITAFQGQEAIHRLQHQQYNELLCAARGYDLAAIEKPLRNRLAWVQRNLSSRRQLAGTAAYEHITAILAHELLSNSEVLEGADKSIAGLWQWHAAEETEHKSVAYDVYIAVGGNARERRIAMLMNTWYFFSDVFRIVRMMWRVEGKGWNLRGWGRGLNYLFRRPGILRRCAAAYFSFYRSNFHPWQHDNRQLVEAWKRDFPN